MEETKEAEIESCDTANENGALHEHSDHDTNSEQSVDEEHHPADDIMEI